MLSVDDFKKLILDDKPVFDSHHSKYPPAHSDDMFTTMISWMEYSNYHYAKVDENIVIMTKLKNKIRLRPPSGKPNVDLLREVLELAKQQETDHPFGVANASMKEWINNVFPKLNFSNHRDYFDYVYLSSDLANLSGSSYAKIRNRLNKFTKNNEYTTEPISNENMDDVNRFLKRWCLWKDCDSDEILANEKKAIIYSMSHFFDLKLSGIVIRINDNIEALAVFEKMNNDTAVVHYEKGSPYFDGIYKAINMETAKILQKDFKYIDRQEDMGIPGLRKAKMSYRPHHMVDVYHINKVDIVLD